MIEPGSEGPARPATALLETDWSGWVGRSERSELRASADAVALLEATLDRPLPGPDALLEPLRHWLWTFAPPATRTSALKPDGHAPRGALNPPWPLPRRMWAGSSVRWLAPVPLDARLTHETTIESVDVKAGRSGTLGFVVLRHRWLAKGLCAIDETQTVVYREPAGEPAGEPVGGAGPSRQAVPAAAPATASASASASASTTAAASASASASAAASASGPLPTAAPADSPVPGSWTVSILPTEVLLFRYSAVTFNTHRIHYDRDYATAEEGYPGLVVHGPLMATLMLDAFRDTNPGARVLQFDFRALAPAFAGAPLEVGGEPSAPGRARVWVRGTDGVTHTTGEVSFG